GGKSRRSLWRLRFGGRADSAPGERLPCADLILARLVGLERGREAYDHVAVVEEPLGLGAALLRRLQLGEAPLCGAWLGEELDGAAGLKRCRGAVGDAGIG